MSCFSDALPRMRQLRKEWNAMKRIIVCLFTLVAAAALCISSMAAEPEKQWVQIDISDQLIQCGGYPDAVEGIRPYTLNWDRAKETLCNGMLAWEETIDIEQYSIYESQLPQLMTEIINENPKLFYVTGRCGYVRYEDGLIESISPEYSEAFSAADAVKYQNRVTEILAGVDKDWSDFEKALYLHDYLVVHARYDMDLLYRRGTGENTIGDTGYTAYGVMIEGVGVCQGYTLAYRELLNGVGIESGTVQSDALNHVWNMVEIGETWYHVDVTWDDPLSPAMEWEEDGRIWYGLNAPDHIGMAVHAYFLQSDTVFRTSHISENDESGCDWVYSLTDVAYGDTYDEWFGHAVLTPFVPLDGNWYYILYEEKGTDGQLIDEGYIYQTAAPESGGGTGIYELTERWTVWEDDAQYWLGIYSGLCAWRDRLVYNTPTEIRSYDLKTGKTNTLYAPDTSDGWLYGFAMDSDDASYVLITDPNTFGNWAWWRDVALMPYEAADVGDYSVCRLDGKLYLRQDAADGTLVLARYDKNGRMVELKVTDEEYGELSITIPAEGTLKIFALDANSAPRCAAEIVSTRAA